MKKGMIFSIIETILIIFIQTSALHVFGITHWAPNLFAAMLIPGALLYGPLYGVLAGAIGGLIIDLLTGYGLGMTAIPLCIGGFAAGSIVDYINGEHYFSSVSLSMILVLFLDIFALLTFYFSRKNIAITLTQVFHTLLVMLSTAGFAAVFHSLLYRQYHARLNKDEIQSKYVRY